MITVYKELGRGPSSLFLEPPFETPAVSEELYARILEVLQRVGLTFVATIEPVSIGQLLANRLTGGFLNHVNPSEAMRAITPPRMRIAINPNNARIESSNNLSIDDQKTMIEREGAFLKRMLPQEARGLVVMRMPSASVLAQLDFAYQRQTGGLLLPNHFARTDDETVPGYAANVGRYDPTSRLGVYGWRRDFGFDNVFALPVLVLPRRSSLQKPL